MQEHLGLEAFERLVHRSCDVSLAYGWLLHLLGCERCRSSFVQAFPGEGDRLFQEVFDTDRPIELLELENPETMERILGHLKSCGLESFLAQPAVPVPLADLCGHPPLRRRLMVENSRRFQSLEVVQQLLERSRSLWHEDPREGLGFAELALVVLDRLSPEEYHPRLIEDFRGATWALIGNGQRILSDLLPAEKSMRRAVQHLENGTGDALEAAEFLSLLATLRKDQQRLQEALDLSERAAQLFLQLGERSRAAGALARTITLQIWKGKPDEARRTGEALIEEYSPDELSLLVYTSIRQNTALAMVEEGWTLPALRILREVRRENPGYEIGRLAALRLTWSEARLLHRTRVFDHAEALYRELRDAFVEGGMTLDAAMLSLDLAHVYQSQNRRKRARRAAGRALPHFTASGLHDLEQQSRRVLQEA